MITLHAMTRWIPVLALLVLLGACGPQPDAPTDATATEATTGEQADPASDAMTEDTDGGESGSEGSTSADADGGDAGADAEDGDGDPVIVGSKNFTEAILLGEMYAQVLEAAGIEVERKLNLGGTPIAHEALLSGEIDLYPEYTSTGLLTVLKADPIQDRDAVYAAVKEGYAEEYDLVWLEPAPFNNPQALATRQDVADQYGTTYTEISEAAPNLVLGGPPEFFEREDGLPGLQEEYGGFEFASTRQLDAGLRYPALRNGDIDVTVAFGTDGQISGYDLVLLEDDRNFFTPYQAAPVVRSDVLEAHPELESALAELQPALTGDVMRSLNWEIDGEGREPGEVARTFLSEQGIVP